ncbi:hypothetical protein EC991_003063 [Linnemannia zychae]|nr:hypothetical protein EC991_003063 [Linnemannia zychae]
MFLQLLRNDYIATQPQEGIPQDSNMHSPSPSPSFLTKYGPWIRHLSLTQACLEDCIPPRTLAITFGASTDTSTAVVDNPNQSESASKPSAQELMLHLLRHCPNLHTLNLNEWDGTDTDLDFWRGVASDVIPHLIEFSVGFKRLYHRDSSSTTVWIPGILLAECSGKMQKLTMPCTNEVSILARRRGLMPNHEHDEDMEVTEEDEENHGEEDEEKEQEEEAQARNKEPLTAMRFLEWIGHEESPLTSLELISFTKRCIHLETLHANFVGDDWSEVLRTCTDLRRLQFDWYEEEIVELLTDILRTGGLPNLDDIAILHGDYDGDDAGDVETANLLMAGRKGWRNVTLPVIDALAADVLVQHTATLESLECQYSPGLTSKHMCQILSSSPRLHSFITLDDGEYITPEVTPILAQDFVDLDSTTNTPRPWLCESTLKKFRAKILGIPRPDALLTFYGFQRTIVPGVDVVEEFPGQGREIQSQVYERLSRFTRLEALELGHDDRDFGAEYNFVETADGDFVLGDSCYQYECLEMNLDSGLSKLETLKELEVLNVFRMATRIKIQDIEWMTMAWPKLNSLAGLNIEVDEADAQKWLEENHPRIGTYPCTFHP